MQLLGSFSGFVNRVLNAAKLGRLSKDDISKLQRLLGRTAKRNTVMAKGILSALNVGGASPLDIDRFSKLLEKGSGRIYDNKEPFSDTEKKEISDIFKRSYVSAKAANWFANQLDELVAEELEEFIKGRRTVFIPTKKSIEPKLEKLKG